MELKVEYLPLSEITPYARNAKQHPREQIAQIKESIEKFGFNDPIALWHGEIVEGHGRYLAAIELGMDKLPVIRLDDLTDEQRRAYALVHNKVNMNSGFDIAALEAELDALSFDMSDFGFDARQLEEEYERPVARYEPPSYDEGYKEAQEPLSKEELEQYSGNADEYLMKRRVIITFRPEQEDAIRELLGIGDDRLRVVYDIDEL